MMRGGFLRCALLSLAGCARVLCAQEAHSGFDLRSTLSAQGMVSNVLTQAPRSGEPGTGGFRAVVYPTGKINENWFVTGALQFVTRPYYYEEFSEPGYGAKGYVLQASLNYSYIANKGSVLVRAGQ